MSKFEDLGMSIFLILEAINLRIAHYKGDSPLHNSHISSQFCEVTQGL